MTAMVRAIRGATTVSANREDAVISRTSELLTEMLERNGVASEDLVSMIFTATSDLSAAFPAAAARALGYTDVPLLGAVELSVDGAPERCVRVMIHCYSDRSRSEIRHVYLHGAEVLRADLPK